MEIKEGGLGSDGPAFQTVRFHKLTSLSDLVFLSEKWIGLKQILECFCRR